MLLGQAALTVVLLIGAGLLLKSFARLQRVDPGFATAGVTTARLTLPPARYATGPRRAALFGDVVARLQGRPGVRAAGAVSVLPLTGPAALAGVAVVGRPTPPVGEGAAAGVRVVAGDAFRALGIPVLRGAALTGREAADAPAQVVVSATFAARRLPGENPVGTRVTMPWGGRTLAATIVGVVGDVRGSALDSLPEPAIYWSLPQLPVARMTLVARYDAGQEAAAGAALRQAVREVDPALPLADVQTVAAHVRASLAPRRLSTTLLAAFAGAALLLAAVGVYGTVAYAVARRTRELGLRAALGATRGALQGMLVREGMRPVLAGTAVGVAGAFLLSGVLRRLMYEVSATDATTFGLVPLVLAAVALLASHLPARRATRADPMAALRDD
jgi:putative ABC transport system permease protein